MNSLCVMPLLGVTHFLLIDLRIDSFCPTQLYPRSILQWRTNASVRFLPRRRRDYSYLKLTSGAADLDWLRAEGKKKSSRKTLITGAQAAAAMAKSFRPWLNWLIIWRRASQSAAVQTLRRPPRIFAICLWWQCGGAKNHILHDGAKICLENVDGIELN